MTEQDRAEFEAWMKDQDHGVCLEWLETDYADHEHSIQYWTWLAARRTQSEQVRGLVEAVVKYGKAMPARLVAETVDENGIAVIENVLYDNEELAATAMFDLAAQLKEQDDE